MSDLETLARAAVEAKSAGVMEDQARFLEAVAAQIAGLPGIERLSSDSPPLVSLLTNGAIQVHTGGTLAALLAESPPRVTLEALAERLEALANVKFEKVRQAVAVVLSGQTTRV